MSEWIDLALYFLVGLLGAVAGVLIVKAVRHGN